MLSIRRDAEKRVEERVILRDEAGLAGTVSGVLAATIS